MTNWWKIKKNKKERKEAEEERRKGGRSARVDRKKRENKNGREEKKDRISINSLYETFPEYPLCSLLRKQTWPINVAFAKNWPSNPSRKVSLNIGLG